MHHNNEQRKKEIYERHVSTLQKMSRNILAFVSTLTGLFILQDRVLRCMDERTPGGIRLAGSGILMGSSLEKSLERAVEFCRKAKVTAVTWHQDCGAVRLFLIRVLGIPNPAPEQVDRAAREFAEKLAEALGVPCFEQELSGVTEMHASYGVYFDGTGQFNLSPELPPGFVVSRAFSDTKYALSEVKVACDIAFGDHGFAQLHNPFLLIAIGKDKDEDLKLMGELKKLALSLPVKERGRVVVTGFWMQA